jgi:hypothetical protein
MPVTRTPVDVIMERVPLSNPWVSEQWQPALVVATGLPGDVDAVPPGAPHLIHDGPDGSQWRFPGCALELHPSEAEGYFLNITAPQPRVFVMWRIDDEHAMPPARPVVVTVSYNEAARMMDGGEQVDSVALPPVIHGWLEQYVAEHYKPEPKKKARRNDPFATEGGRDPAFDAGKIRRPGTA